MSTSAERCDAAEPAAAAPVLAEGVLSLLTPMVSKCDESIAAAVESQALLSQEIDHVADELQAFLGASQLPSFEAHAQRLADVRRRVATAGTTLTQVQARLSKVEAMADALQEQQHPSSAPSEGG